MEKQTEIQIVDRGIKELNIVKDNIKTEIIKLKSKLEGITYAKSMLKDLRDELLNKKTNESYNIKETIGYSVIDTPITNMETITSRNVINK